MKIKSAEFRVSAPGLDSCPASELSEFAFIGRSNVGKSSLINMLVERRELAKVSNTPGKTQLINFFTINDAWSLVDLPGYGYAAVGQGKREDFNQAVGDYLEHRENLACIFVLIDSRLPPQRLDVEFLKWLGTISARFVLVFTKTDKQSATQTRNNIELFKKNMSAWQHDLPPIFASSAQTKAGRQEILDFIGQTLAES